MNDLRKDLKEIEFDDGVGRKDHIGHNELFTNDREDSLNVLKIGWVSDLKVGDWDMFFRKEE